MLPSVFCYHTLIVFQVLGDVGRCVRSWSCSLSSLKWKVNGQYWWGILLFQQMLAVIKHVVADNIICLSSTQLMHAPAHDARNTVQQLQLRKTQLHFSWAMAPTGQSWTQLITRFRESIAVWIWVASLQNWRNYAFSHAHLYNEQFVHGRLDRALIFLGLAVFWAPLCLRCTWCYM